MCGIDPGALSFVFASVVGLTLCFLTYWVGTRPVEPAKQKPEVALVFEFPVQKTVTVSTGASSPVAQVASASTASTPSVHAQVVTRVTSQPRGPGGKFRKKVT